MREEVYYLLLKPDNYIAIFTHFLPPYALFIVLQTSYCIVRQIP
jgi:hypothetical protein